ncbi:ArnT family glycosyltransferase [Anabaena subtropica]|uniref:Glycosyltransferase family 39 protein n=1 Tax=Anabaena subtropica FACHB-260 TaxID=2692884 RepID=A0ABR8CQX0_9NOST|nr:glycosyltransferase family 39 protein [Anabaena subtropica]MBD2344778.1 glycosyltransferase family 39 protein [Anabaena subtropica FACHB-260]
MFYKLQSLQSTWQRISFSVAFPYITLFVWTTPLLLLSSGENSLIAHDEALYAWRARQIFDSGDWVSAWSNIHHKTPGFYWLIASFYQLFGVNEFTVRLPSMICGIFSLLLVYEIGKIILNQKLAWLATAILSLEFLWLQYCRLGNPDMPMIFLILLAIYSLIQAELYPNYKYSSGLIFIAGLSLGLGFLVRSFVIVLPTVALLPYLIFEHRRHRHLTNPWLYLGLMSGFIPIFVWSWFNWQRHSNNIFATLVEFVLRLGSEERDGNGILFYFWNISLKAFPWTFFSLLGLFLVILRPKLHYHLILVGFPIILFVELSIFSTRLSHYGLCLYPFIALLAAIGLDWLGKIYDMGYATRKPWRQKGNILRILSYACSVIGILFLIAAIVVFIWGDRLHSIVGDGVPTSLADRKYAVIGLIVGLSWFIVPMVWIGRYKFGCKFLTSSYWIAGWLIPCWLALAFAGGFGLLGDYNPTYRTFLQQPAIASILQDHPIHFVQVNGKNSVLLNFYTPVHGQKVDTIAQLPPSSYAWVDQNNSPEISRPHRIIGEVDNYKLIQVQP